jgi:hypothetical protein
VSLDHRQASTQAAGARSPLHRYRRPRACTRRPEMIISAHSFLHEQNPSQLRLRPARLQLQDAAVIKLLINYLPARNSIDQHLAGAAAYVVLLEISASSALRIPVHTKARKTYLLRRQRHSWTAARARVVRTDRAPRVAVDVKQKRDRSLGWSHCTR